MKQFDQWFLPEKEQHLQKWMTDVNDRRYERLTYQGHKYTGTMKNCPEDRRRVAVDIGAHVGLWSFLMAHDFEQVQCFEPMQEHIECWHKNMDMFENAKLHACALGANNCFANLQTYTPDSSGDTRVQEVSEIADFNPHSVPMMRLDYYRFENVDLIKIDCEGYELPVLQGARETLLRCKPLVIVEQKQGHAEVYGLPQLGAVEYLKDLGATHISDVGGDYILGWV